MQNKLVFMFCFSLQCQTELLVYNFSSFTKLNKVCSIAANKKIIQMVDSSCEDGFKFIIKYLNCSMNNVSQSINHSHKTAELCIKFQYFSSLSIALNTPICNLVKLQSIFKSFRQQLKKFTFYKLFMNSSIYFYIFVSCGILNGSWLWENVNTKCKQTNTIIIKMKNYFSNSFELQFKKK